MNVALVGDLVSGTCLCVPSPPGPYPATGTITTSSTMFFSSGRQVAQVGISTVMFPCGTAIINGYSTIQTTGAPAAKTGDQVSGCATGTVTGTAMIQTI